MAENNFRQMLENANAEITALRNRIAELESKVSMTGSTLPKTDLLSDSFLRRAFTVWGHQIVASLIVVLPIYLLIFIIAMLANL
ncbi:MAG: hypothetical protein ACE5I1_31070 [bacterium]